MTDDEKKEQKILETRKEREERLKSELTVSKELLEVEESYTDAIQRAEELREGAIKKLQEEISKAVELVAIAREKGEEGEKELERYQKILVLKKKEVKDLIKERDLNQDIGSISSAYLQTLTGINGKTQTLIGGLLKTKDLSYSIGVALSNFKLGDGLSGATLNTLDVGLSKMKEATIAFALAQDSALASFNKTTGAMGKYDDMLIKLETTNRLFGVSTEDAASATQALYAQMNTFSSETPQVQANLVRTTAVLEKFGVSADTTAKNITIANRALGMSAQESEVLQRQLFSTAEALSLPPQIVAEGFSSAAPILAKHGKNMVGVFQNLAKSSKETGLAMDDLLGIADKFDTFEGAAEAAGTLNTILGGDLLNSMDLLLATEDERIKMIQNTVDSTGRSWASMNRWEKKALANAAGITDMNKAAMLFNPTMVGMTEEQKRSAKSMKEMEENIGKVRPLLDELKSAALSFAVAMRPMIVKIKELLEWVVKVDTRFKEWSGQTLAGLIPAILGVMAVAVVFWKLWRAYDMWVVGKTIPKQLAHIASTIQQTAATQASAAATTEETIAQKANTLATSNGTIAQNGANKAKMGAGKAAKSAVGPMLAFGAAVLMIGGAIWLAAKGMTGFVKAFKGMDPEQIKAVAIAIGVFMGTLTLMIGILAVVAIAAGGAAIPLLAIGAAVGLVGAGIGIAAAGMSLLVGALTDAFAVVKNDLESFILFAATLTGISWIAPGLAATFGSLAIGLGAMALALRLIKTDDLQAMGNMFMGIGNITNETVSALGKVSAEIKKIGAELSNIDKDVLVSFGTLINPPKAGVSTEEVVARIQAAAAAINVPAAAPAPAAAPTKSEGNVYHITVQMDGEVVGKKVMKQVGDELEEMVSGKLPRVY